MKVLALLLTLFSAACVPVPFKGPAWKEVGGARTYELRVGDTVRVHTKAGKTHVFRIYKLEENAFYGTARDNQNYRVGYGALDSMEVRREGGVEWVPIQEVMGAGNLGPVRTGGGFGLGLLGTLGLSAALRRLLRVPPNKALHSDAPALRDVAALVHAPQRAALGFPRSLRSLGAGERQR